ncbi:MAG: hypothetical protein V4581_11450 [Bacteroidota bacterium]
MDKHAELFKKIGDFLQTRSPMEYKNYLVRDMNLIIEEYIETLREWDDEELDEIYHQATIQVLTYIKSNNQEN